MRPKDKRTGYSPRAVYGEVAIDKGSKTYSSFKDFEKERKSMARKTKTIKEDVQIPGTDMILEAGDKIEVRPSNGKKNVKESYDVGNLLLPEQEVGEQGIYPDGSPIKDSVAVGEYEVLEKGGYGYVLRVGNLTDKSTLQLYLSGEVLDNIEKYRDMIS